MLSENAEFLGIMQKFADSGWELINAPSKAWLLAKDDGVTGELIAAIWEADKLCGSCGCEFDPLYKRALELLRAG